MSTFKLSAPIKLKPKDAGTRGQLDSNEILEAICGDWEELQRELRKFGDEEISQLKQHFNELIDGHDSLGEALNGYLDDFKLVIADLKQE